MPASLATPLLLLASEIGERYVGRLLLDAAALHVARKNLSKAESWLRRQSLDADLATPKRANPVNPQKRNREFQVGSRRPR